MEESNPEESTTRRGIGPNVQARIRADNLQHRLQNAEKTLAAKEEENKLLLQENANLKQRLAKAGGVHTVHLKQMLDKAEEEVKSLHAEIAYLMEKPENQKLHSAICEARVLDPNPILVPSCWNENFGGEVSDEVRASNKARIEAIENYLLKAVTKFVNVDQSNPTLTVEVVQAKNILPSSAVFDKDPADPSILPSKGHTLLLLDSEMVEEERKVQIGDILDKDRVFPMGELVNIPWDVTMEQKGKATNVDSVKVESVYQSECDYELIASSCIRDDNVCRVSYVAYVKPSNFLSEQLEHRKHMLGGGK